MPDPRLERLASFLLEPDRTSFEAPACYGSPIDRAGPVCTGLLVDGQKASSNAWKWKVQRVNPRLLELPTLHVIMEQLNTSPGPCFDLKLGQGKLASTVLQHCICVVGSIAGQGIKFKVGITSNPFHRWHNESYGYIHQKIYTHMSLIAIVSTMEAAAYIEAAVLREYGTHCCCQNDAPGGEGCKGDVQPGFVYVVSA